MLPNGCMIMDTPGMRELGLCAAQESIGKSFSDVEAFFGQCRFRDCTHTAEPGCAIYAALSQGLLSPKRWDSYRRLKEEAAFAADKDAYLAAKQKKFKSISKIVRQSKKK